MNLFDQFLTIQMLIFCLVVFVLVWAQRKIIELTWPKIKEKIIWREFFLPIGPPATGAALGALISTYPFPDVFNNLTGRIFCGIVCGLASAKAYRIMKAFFVEKTGQNIEQKDPDDLSQV